MVGRGLRTLVAGALLAVSAAAPAEACRLALAFALDVSASIDDAEYRLQIEGLADGLRDPAVKSAILASGDGVALAAYEWSGTHQQGMIEDWTLVDTAAGIDAFAAGLSAHKRGYDEFPTAVGYALAYGHVLMRSAPPCERRVIDISGDGVSNDGFGPDAAYRAFDFDGISVNALVVGAGDLELMSFFQSQVIRGPGAFIEVARDYQDYRRAMLRKLLREIGDNFFAEAHP